MEDKISNREFLKKMFMIAFPIAIHNFIFSFQNIVDIVMIGKLGKEEIAGIGFANQLYFIFILVLFGIYSGASTFIAQYWGKKDMKNIHKIIGLSLCAGLIVSSFAMILTEYFNINLIKIYKPTDEVLKYGASYLKINGYSLVAAAIGFCYGVVLRNTGNPFLPMYSSFIAVCFNVFFNYCLIFGNLGFPRMGVEGAAIATVAARYIDVIILISVIILKKKYLLAKISEMLNFELKFVLKFLKISMPVIFQEILWVLGVNSYFMVYGRMGTEAAAAINISNSFERMAFVLFFGLASASAVLIGNEIGSGNEKRAFEYSKKFMKICPLTAAILSILIVLFVPFIINLFGVKNDVYIFARNTVYIFLIMFPIKVFNLTNIIGVLRSGGDSKAAFLLDVLPMWLIGVPLSYVVGIVFGYPIYIVYLFISAEEVVKMIFGYYRFVSKKWIVNLSE